MENDIIACMQLYYCWSFKFWKLPINPSDTITFHAELIDIYLNQSKNVPSLRFEFWGLLAV